MANNRVKGEIENNITFEAYIKRDTSKLKYLEKLSFGETGPTEERFMDTEDTRSTVSDGLDMK